MKYSSVRAISIFLLILLMSFYFGNLNSSALPDAENAGRKIRVAQIDLSNF